MGKVKLVALPGDGIGPEVTEGALTVLKKACEPHGVELEIEEHPFGGASLDLHDTPATEETLQAAKEADAVFLGAVGGEKWDHLTGDARPESGLLRLRSELEVFANFRPVRVYPELAHASTLKSEVISGVDILIVRELTGGIYFGRPRVTELDADDPWSLDTMKYHRSEIVRLAEKAFEAARLRNRKVCSVDKANVLGSSRFWRDTVVEFAKDHPDIELSHMLVDNCAMQLIRDPKQFDVVMTSNLFGDILSDEVAMLTGSIGMLPSASLGNGPGLYEPVHGSAPDIAGQDKANPLAAIASAALLARYSLGLEEAAVRIEASIEKALTDGYRTGDIYSGGEGERLVGTQEMCDKVISSLEEIQSQTA